VKKTKRNPTNQNKNNKYEGEKKRDHREIAIKGGMGKAKQAKNGAKEKKNENRGENKPLGLLSFLLSVVGVLDDGFQRLIEFLGDRGLSGGLRKVGHRWEGGKRVREA
jgi:hypothetical protein